MSLDPRVAEYRRAADKMRQGAFDVEIPAEGFDDIARLGESLQALAHHLKARFDEAAKLARIAERVNAGLVLSEVMDRLFESFRPVIPYERIGLALLEDKGKVVRSCWARADWEEIKLGIGYSAKLAGSSLEELARSGEPRILNDLEAYLEEHPQSESTRLIVAEGVRSSLTCPLVALGKPIGFLFFSSCNKNTYRDLHQGYFVQLATQVSLILEKSRLYGKMLNLNRRLQKAQKALEHDASHDSLTGLWNRKAILSLLEHEVARAQREQEPLAVIILDLDNFKKVNDEHGHLLGDEVLRELSRRLVACLRSADFLGRVGGEEFLIILSPCDKAETVKVLERVRLTCAGRPFSTSAGDLAITVSGGAATEENLEGIEVSQILRVADEALYRAKNDGRNRYELAPVRSEAEL